MVERSEIAPPLATEQSEGANTWFKMGPLDVSGARTAFERKCNSSIL